MPTAGPAPGFAPPRSDRRAASLALGVVGVVGALALSAGKITRHVVQSRADALGWHADVDDTALGFGTVRVRGLHLRSLEVPSVHVSFSDVEVHLGLGSIRRLEIHGGTVRVQGSRESVERELKAWRSTHAAHEGTRATTRASVLPVSVDGIDVRWDRATEDAPTSYAWGVRFERAANGAEAVGTDLLRADISGAMLEISGGLARFERDEDRRVLKSLSARRFQAAVDLDAIPRPEPANPSAPVSSATDRGPRLRSALDHLGKTLASWLRPSAHIELSPVHLEVNHAGQELNIGPATVVLARDSESVALSMTSGSAEASAPLRLDLAVPLGTGPVEAGLVGGPISLRALGVEEHDMGLEDVDRAEVEVNGHATLAADGASVRVTGTSRFSALSLYNPKLAAEPVRGLRLGLSGQAELRLDGTRTSFDDLEIAVGKVKLHAQGEIERAEGNAKGKIHVEVPLAACEDMLTSIPSAVAPLLSGLEATGTFAFAGELEFDTRKLGDIRVDWDAANECRASVVPPALSPERFSRPWTRTVVGLGGVPTTIESGPGTPKWTSLVDISPYMAVAVVVCEDASFWVHGGFNQKSIRDSIRDNLRAGKFLRGASTVSMQLAKNLYLAREKTLSRKLQESVLTLLLEQSLTKEKILELYLNVIEFAPGVYGIGPAADHYFHALPKDLSLGQAFYLVSILPNPKAQHFAPDGTLSPAWTEYLHHLMEIARKIGRIDDRDLASGLAETLRFGEPSATGATAEPSSGSANSDVLDLAPREPETEEGP